MKIENGKRLFEVLSRIDDEHFAVVENECVEIYSKTEFIATPVPSNVSTCIGEMNLGSLLTYQGIKAEMSTIKAELKRKGFDEPKGFSSLEGYIDDRINELGIN